MAFQGDFDSLRDPRLGDDSHCPFCRESPGIRQNSENGSPLPCYSLNCLARIIHVDSGTLRKCFSQKDFLWHHPEALCFQPVLEIPMCDATVNNPGLAGGLARRLAAAASRVEVRGQESGLAAVSDRRAVSISEWRRFRNTVWRPPAGFAHRGQQALGAQGWQ